LLGVRLFGFVLLLPFGLLLLAFLVAHGVLLSGLVHYVSPSASSGPHGHRVPPGQGSGKAIRCAIRPEDQQFPASTAC
jgi:hypothetical protein